GVVSSETGSCGVVVIAAVRLSVMPERVSNVNTKLPADDRYTIDFNPRPPGPSGGRLAFDPAPRGSAAPPPPPKGPQSIDLHFDFDRAVSFRHPAQLMTVLDTARQVGAKRLQVTGVRGVHRLSDGTVLRESAPIVQRRRDEVAHLLAGAGLNLPAG